MKNFFLFVLLSAVIFSCNQDKKKTMDNDLNRLYKDYFEERLSFFPLEATSQGDNRFNDQLPNDISEAYRTKLGAFYQKYLDRLLAADTSKLSEDEKVVYNTLKYSLETELQGLTFKTHLIPFQQFWGLPLTMGQLGSGQGSQPFKTVKDYEDWLKRVDGFAVWTDTAIANFKKGMETGYVLPKSLVVKMIPQMQDMVSKDPEKSLFYGPVNQLPSGFSAAEKEDITKKYNAAITEKLNPSFEKLRDFLKNEYLPEARLSSGVLTIPEGKAYYNYTVKYWTTTSKTPDEIFQQGMSEVIRIRKEMEKVKEQTGFKGDLNAFFQYLKTDRKFTPYQKPEEVLAAFAAIQSKITPHLASMFKNTPKTKFEIRRTEAFREASASAEYVQGSADGSRPGIFYVPIPDARKFNITSGMESLFLHEAIPGHHYQISLQQENTGLPDFMRFSWYGAYGEGWALYTESLGKELGLYTDPYQYMGALGDEIHRAIRLVVDVGIHTKGWSREEAIKYMMDNQAISEDGATAEIERYMAIPGQALSYKIGALKIAELRARFSSRLGDKFVLADFHDQFLKQGCLPLDVLEEKLNAWADKISPPVQ